MKWRAQEVHSWGAAEKEDLKGFPILKTQFSYIDIEGKGKNGI